jgi:hypothetical protein
MIHDPVNQNANPRKREQKRYRSDEHPATGPIGNGGADQEPKPCQLQKYQKQHHHQAGEGEQ